MQADIAGAAIDQQDHHHILSCLPTGMGKTLPTLITACLLPQEDLELGVGGSTTILVVPLTSIKQQLMDDCGRMSISVLDGDQVVTFSFTIPAKLNSKCSSQLLPADLERELVKHPTALLASPEFLASTEVFFS